MHTKITKDQFLELVDLAIAVHGPRELHDWGSIDGSSYQDNLDEAIAEYYFWTHHYDGSPRVVNPTYDLNWPRYSQEILNHWTEG